MQGRTVQKLRPGQTNFIAQYSEIPSKFVPCQRLRPGQLPPMPPFGKALNICMEICVLLPKVLKIHPKGKATFKKD